MKKLFTFILLATFFISCSSDDDNNTQDYTSFVVTLQNTESSDLILTNCVAGCKKDGKYIKLGDLGDLSKGKQSKEITITDNSVTDVYIFTDYNAVNRLDILFKLNKNQKNIFEIPKGTKGIGVTDKTDPTQYPQ
ncbi:hypothetical protein [Dysgonomonas reticulitermitis]